MDKYVYCIDCKHCKIDADNLVCIHKNECCFLDPEESRPRSERPFYECNMVCERCCNSRFVISENGLKAVCCLSAKKAMKCIATHDYFCSKLMFVGALDSLLGSPEDGDG